MRRRRGCVLRSRSIPVRRTCQPAAAQDILRIVQESLTNVARHAGADHVVVRLETRGNRLRVAVEDDGCGFDPDQVTGRLGSFGLRGLKERAAHLAAELEVRSAPGRGTTGDTGNGGVASHDTL